MFDIFGTILGCDNHPPKGRSTHTGVKVEEVVDILSKISELKSERDSLKAENEVLPEMLKQKES